MQKGWFGIWIWRVAAVLARSSPWCWRCASCRASGSQTWSPGTPGRRANWTSANSTRPTGRPGWRARPRRLRSRPHDARRDRAGRTRSLEPLLRRQPGQPARFAHNWNRSYALLPEGNPWAPWSCCMDSPTRPTRCATWRGSTPITVLPRSACAFPAMARCPRVSRGALAGLAGRDPPRGARGAATRGPANPCTSSATRMAARWPCSTRSMRVGLHAGTQPAGVVLPMIGLTSFARYAGVAGWPALLPRFSKSAWLESFPSSILSSTARFPSTRRASPTSSRR